MDAKVGDHVVTPRQGCPVEINALWYNSICIYNAFVKLLGREEERWSLLENKVKENFRAHFMNSSGYLPDVIIPCEYVDDSFRPNQVYAISLPFSLLSQRESELLLGRIHEKLWTLLGLRSLAQDHPDFIGKYGGDQWHRDTAYHQGTVWSFLMGEYLLAVLKTSNDPASAKMKVLELMKGLQHHFYHDDAIHAISEIFDGQDPDEGRGCIQQAWSVGMLLLVFDRLKQKESIKPKARSHKMKLTTEV
jgi:glycogen debranching enzyme